MAGDKTGRLVKLPNDLVKRWNFTFTKTGISTECNGVIVLDKLYTEISNSGNLAGFCGNGSVLLESEDISYFQLTLHDAATQMLVHRGGKVCFLAYQKSVIS